MAADSTIGFLSRLARPLVICLALPGASSAAEITLSGACDLIAAIQNANDTVAGQPNPDCAAGDPAGPDTITLTADVTLTDPFSGNDGLPEITSEMVLEGKDHIVSREGGSPAFRILTVSVDGDLTLSNTIVSGGWAYSSGGGILNSGTVTLVDSTLTGNTAITTTGGSARGGGLFNAAGATATIIRSTLSDNSALGYAWTTPPIPVPGRGFGGAVSNEGTLTLVNATLSNNKSLSQLILDAGGGGGGGIYTGGGTVTVLSSTSILNRSCSEDVFSGGCGSEQSFLEEGIFTHGGALSLTSSIIQDGCVGDSPTDGGGNLGCVADPAGGVDTTLADNGGPTLTHALLAGSNAIDNAGSCGQVTDQRGAPRFDGTCDSGAFEYGGCPVLKLMDDTVMGIEAHEECAIHVGPNFAVAGPAGDLTLTAGTSVTLFNGLEVLTDASAVLGLDPNLQVTSAIATAKKAGSARAPRG